MDAAQTQSTALLTSDHLLSSPETSSVPLKRSQSVPSSHKRSNSKNQYSQVQYVRTAPVGLPSTMPSPQLPSSPIKCDLVRSNTAQDMGSPLKRQPTMHRSDSLPQFPPEPKVFSADDPLRLVGKVDDLPSNPKLWSPSQLTVYLAHVLRITPGPIIRDIIAFVIAKRLTGRKFLRFREKDFRDLDINPAWARIMAEARERLRIDCLRGRILPAAEMEDLEDIEPSDPSFLVGDADKGQWQKSWRRDTGCKSKGRVKGLSNLFDREASEQDEHSTPNSVFRTRTVSDASVSSIESISDTETTYDIDWKALSAIELESSDVSFDSNATLSPSCFTDSGISATASKIYSDWSPPRITHPVSEPPEVHLSLPDSEKQYTTLTAKPESANRDLKLHDIFACADAASTGMTSIPSRNGSMILVKKSQLAELEKRMEQMEEMVSKLQAEDEQKATLPFRSTSVSQEIEGLTLSGLSGYLLMTSVGVGLIATELILAKLFRR